MIIRNMRSSDLEMMRQLEVKMRVLEPNVFGELDEDAYIENFKKNRIEDFKLNEVILCIEEGSIIGRIDVIVEHSFMDFKKIGYIDWVYVLKSHRNKGIAKLLFKEAEKHFNKLDCTMYYLFVANNEEARGFYDSIDIEIKTIDRGSKKLK